MDGDSAVHYLRSLIGQLKTIRGLDAVSLASFAPLASSPYKEDIRRLDHPDRAVLQAPAEFVTEDFLKILHIPLLHGRVFQKTDKFGGPRVAVVSQSVAKRLFRSESPLGRHIQFGTEPETRDIQIIGVAADVPLEDPHAREQGFILLSLWQLPRMVNWGTLQVQFSGPATEIGTTLREEVKKARHQTVFLLRTISELRDMALLQEQMLASAGRLYGSLAALLAGVGLFGLLTFFVSARKSELALRIALGASRVNISFLILREALRLLGLGVGIGLPLSFAATRAATAALYGVSPLSISPVLLAIAILCLVAITAVAGPVYRATSLDPNRALRQE